jgi:hypothetical protein
MMPSHAARAALVATGVIGTPTPVQVSCTQQYHAIALIRGLLGAGRGSVSVRASRFTAPLVSPLSLTTRSRSATTNAASCLPGSDENLAVRVAAANAVAVWVGRV